MIIPAPPQPTKSIVYIFRVNVMYVLIMILNLGPENGRDDMIIRMTND